MESTHTGAARMTDRAIRSDEERCLTPELSGGEAVRLNELLGGDWRDDMFEETQEQLEFHNKLELWYGPADRKAAVLNRLEGVRLQGGYICLELIDDDGDSVEVAIRLAELVKIHGDFIKYIHPIDAEDSKSETLKALGEAIVSIESQHSEVAV